MNDIDYTSLDGRLLKALIAVHGTGSVTKAAAQLDVTQSSVSHSLNRLRDITGDMLFVPKGRGITPTERADSLVVQAQTILNHMRDFSEQNAYDPLKDEREFNIAANDYEIEVIVKPLMSRLRKLAPLARVNISRAHTQNEWAGLLRSGQVDLVLTPVLKTEESDLKQQTIISDGLLCFYDGNIRDAPDTLDKYCAAPHAIMSPGFQRRTVIDEMLARLGRTRHVAVSMPSFSSVASVLAQTDMVAVMPSKLRHSIFQGFATCPFDMETVEVVVVQLWHVRSDGSERQKWLRRQIKEVSAHV